MNHLLTQRRKGKRLLHLASRILLFYTHFFAAKKDAFALFSNFSRRAHGTRRCPLYRAPEIFSREVLLVLFQLLAQLIYPRSS